MKKFLSLILAAMMLLSSVAFAEAVPSKSVEDTVVAGSPSAEVVGINAVAAPGLFVADESEAAVSAVADVVAALETAAAPIAAYAAETKTAVAEALAVEAETLTVAAAPVALNVNDAVAAELAETPVLTLANVPVGEKFVVVLTIISGGVKEEVVLTAVAADAATSEVYAAVPVDVVAKIQAADVVVATVLTTAVAE